MTMILVSKIMTKDVKVIEIPGNRKTLIETMRKEKVSIFPVVKQGSNKLEGLVGRKNILRKPFETQISLLMDRKVTTCKPTDSALDVARKFWEYQITKIPVVDEDDNVIGIVSITDIIWKIIAVKKYEIEVIDYYQRGITCLWEETPLRVALEIFKFSEQEGLPVISMKGDLIGIVSAHDFMKAAEISSTSDKSSIKSGSEAEASSWDSESVIIIVEKELTLSEDQTVKSIIQVNVVTCFEDNTINEVAKKSRNAKIDQLPVVDEKKHLLGIVNSFGLIRAFIHAEEAETTNR